MLILTNIILGLNYFDLSVSIIKQKINFFDVLGLLTDNVFVIFLKTWDNFFF